jgi:hypothetical protein
VIVVLSIMPLFVEWWRHRKQKNQAIEKDAA